MRHEGLRSAATTTMVAAGRIAPKSSPWTLPTASQSSGWVRYMRVRTTSRSVAPASVSARSMILKTWRVCSSAEAWSAPTGPVPETCTVFPMRTAREKPIRGSKGELPEMFCRGICVSLSSKNPAECESHHAAFAGVRICRAERQLFMLLTLRRCRLWPEAALRDADLLEPLLFQEEDQIADPVGVAPLVVVPGDDLHHVADHLGERGIDDRGERVALEIRRDELVLFHPEDTLQRTCGVLLQSIVDDLHRDWLFDRDREIDHR